MSSFMRAAMVTAAVSGLVLLSACGGGDGSGKSDDIEGAKDGKKSPSASPSSSASEDSDAPEFDFPKGFRVVFEDDITGDPKKDEVLRDHEYATKAISLSYAKGDPDLPVAKRYVQDAAGETFRYNLKKYRKSGKVSTGTTRYYNRKVELGKKAAAVTFCESQRDAFAKMVDTGKVVRTKPSLSDFTSVKDIMEKRGGTWVVISSSAKGSDEKCAR
ncbi:hypothetical protein [Streptomyces sp. 3N207]|uniref:hypothetical protein n=1 Tax=Streptomyces sp. 3N207 TaxID=3457417 RepID=UPI003FD51D15